MVREKAPGLETWVIFTPASGNKTSLERAVDIAALFYFTDSPRRTCDQDWRAGLLNGCPILAAGEGGLAVRCAIVIPRSALFAGPRNLSYCERALRTTERFLVRHSGLEMTPVGWSTRKTRV